MILTVIIISVTIIMIMITTTATTTKQQMQENGRTYIVLQNVTWEPTVPQKKIKMKIRNETNKRK